MQALTAGLTKAGTGIDGIVWNILGQTYVPKSVNEASFSWHATFPPALSCRRIFIRPRTSSSTCRGALHLLLDGRILSPPQATSFGCRWASRMAFSTSPTSR